MLLLLALLMQYCKPTLGADTLYNVALYKPAFQSSLYKDWVPGKGNDGKTTTAELGGQCIHTLIENYGWWMVDLLDTYVIKSVVLTNRNDSLEKSMRLSHFQIDVFIKDPRLLTSFPYDSGEICYQQTEALTMGIFNWTCSQPLIGRYVRLIMLTTQCLHFCELKVMAPLPTQASEFKVYKNKKYNTLSKSDLMVSRSMQCVSECVKRRYTDGCTAINWFPSTRLCQLLNVDTRVVNVVVQLTTIQDVNFYVVKY